MLFYVPGLASITLLLNACQDVDYLPKMVTFADDIAVADNLQSLRKWWNFLQIIDPN